MSDTTMQDDPASEEKIEDDTYSSASEVDSSISE